MSSAGLKNLPSFEEPAEGAAAAFEIANLTDFEAAETGGQAVGTTRTLRFDIPLEAGSDNAELDQGANTPALSEPDQPTASDVAVTPHDTSVSTEISRDVAASVETETQAPTPPLRAEPEGAAPSARDTAVDKTELQAMIAGFEQSLETIRAEMRAEISRQMVEIVDTLFPALAREFLSEEIMRHVPNLVPDRVFGVEIQAPPELAEQLDALFENNKQSPANASVRSMPGKRAGSVSINWGEGGYDYEFEPILARCRQRLAIPQSD